jgi:soluble lytic murein transglycosylase-like protein
MALCCDLALVAIAAAASALGVGAPAPAVGPAQEPARSVILAPATDALRRALVPAKAAGNPGYVALAQFLSHRYRISAELARAVVSAAHDAGERYGVDPLLLLAVMAIESSFNPAARSVVGAEGLMQIMPAQHRDELKPYGGKDAVLDPRINIALGAQILKKYIGRTGSLKAGLCKYNGVPLDRARRYPHKVIAERTRLQDVLRAQQRYAADLVRVRTSPAAPRRAP